MNGHSAWTFMVYIAGDNNLSAAGDNDLAEMRRVGSTDQVQIVAQFDNAGDFGTRRIHVQREGRDERVETLAETDSGSPEVLSAFIAWAAGEYPAERYALILWNHGSGWEPSEMDRIARSVDAAGYSEREVTERSASPLRRAFFRSSLERIFRQNGPTERAICSDDGSGHSLDTIELDHVLADAVDKLGRRIDLLGMDACLMSSLEVAYEVRDRARFLVGSEENAPNQGWPYDRILATLTADPALATEELARSIVEHYIAYYRERDHRGDVTQAALDLGLVAELTQPLDELANALLEHFPAAAAEIWSAQRKAARFWHNTLWDLAHFCQELENATTSEAVRASAAAVRAALAPGAGRPILAESHRGPKVDRCAGVNLYLVPPLTAISRYYSDLAFTRDTRWLEMLEAYHAA